MQPYAVVRFKDEDSYSEIPTAWLLGNGKCKWPKTKNVGIVMLKNILPDESWEEFDIEIDCYCTTLESARKKAGIKDYTSNDETVLLGKGQRKKLSKHYSSCDESDSSIDIPPKRKRCGKKVSIKVEDTTISSLSTDVTDLPVIFTDQNGIIGSNMQTPTIMSLSSPTDIPSSDTVNLLNTILQTVTEIKSEVCNLKLALYRAEHSVDDLEDIKKWLPLPDIPALETFEMYLCEDNERLLRLKKLIITIGGRGAKDHAVRCLARMYSNSLSVNCSWLGQRNNYRVCDLKSINVLKDYLISEYHVNEKEFESMASDWFRHSKQRLFRIDRN